MDCGAWLSLSLITAWMLTGKARSAIRDISFEWLWGSVHNILLILQLKRLNFASNMAVGSNNKCNVILVETELQVKKINSWRCIFGQITKVFPSNFAI